MGESTSWSQRPAYTADLPVPHVMEAGTPHSRYPIVERAALGWRADHIALPYDWESAAAAAEARRRPDWAGPLRTGRATPHDPSEGIS